MAGHWSSPELGHGPLRAPGDCADSMGGWRGGGGYSLAVRFGDGVSQSSRRWGNVAAAKGARRGRCSGLRREENGAGMSAVRWGRAPRPFIGGRGGVEASRRGGDQPAAAVMAINDHPVQWGGEMEGLVGSEEGGKYSAVSGRGGVIGAAAGRAGGGGG
jgi:hypothetical protein